MKKVFLLVFSVFALVAFSLKADAQQALKKTTANPTGAITNTGADTSSYTELGLKLHKLVEFTVTVTRASGTLAGTATLYGSMDGVKYTLIDSLSISNAASYTGTLYVQNKAFKYWRIITGGMTTVSATVAGTVAIFD